MQSTAYGLRSKVSNDAEFMALRGKDKAGIANYDRPQPWDFVKNKKISKFSLRRINNCKQRLKVKCLAELYKKRYV